MARLTAAQRKRLPDSAFAGPNRSYPINDASHARNALARVSQFGSPGLQAKVQKRVAADYGIGQQMAKRLKKGVRRHRRRKRR